MNLSANAAWMVALGVGVAVLIGTQSALGGLIAGIVTFFLIRALQPAPPRQPAIPTTSRPLRTERATPIEVVCTTVTPERQEWVSVKTGRLYDVLSANGLAGARPGDRGRVTLRGTSWKIDPLPQPPKRFA